MRKVINVDFKRKTIIKDANYNIMAELELLQIERFLDKINLSNEQDCKIVSTIYHYLCEVKND